MSHHFLRSTCVLLAVCAVAWCSGPCLGQSPDIGDFIHAGEFAPAISAAHNIENVAVRDQWLGRIAEAQAKSGARRASLMTVSDIRDDRARGGTLGEIGSQMLGGGAGRGGAALADFDTLIELITSTIAPDSWDEVGGAGAIEPFPTGVYVDAAGVLARMAVDRDAASLDELHRRSKFVSQNRELRTRSEMRKVSLTRLEKQIQMLRAQGLEPDASMHTLAGLYQIKYLLVYPQTGDVVLAGPAGDWRTNEEGRQVNVETGRPVLSLDDLVVTLRSAMSQHPRFGCAITPTQENLAAAQSFLANSAGKSVKSYQRDRWVQDLREKVGLQEIEVFGIDPQTRAARVLVEADYHMKLIGMGLEPGTAEVPSYLDLVKASGKAPPEMSVLRWWFAVNNKGVGVNATRDAFELRGPSVRLLSENELLTETGQRVHTGKSDALNDEFANGFTKQFELLSRKYPVYAELQNIFDLAVVAALIHEQDIAGQLGWHLLDFGPQGTYQPIRSAAPEKVLSVVNHIELSPKQFIAGVSGGVSVDVRPVVEKMETDQYGTLSAERTRATPDDLPRDAWWWD